MWWAYKGEHPTDEALSDVLGMSAFTPDPAVLPHCREPTRCAMCGRLRVGKSFLHVCGIGRRSHVFGL
jgi:hypothetical protein